MSTDKSAHELFRYASDKESCFRYLRNEHISCPFCRNELEATYCEERLYMFRCVHCKIVVLAEGKSPRDAAGKLTVTAKQGEEGRLVVLPCKVGTPIWWIDVSIEPNERGKWVTRKRIKTMKFDHSVLDWIDTPFYLTRAEAEAALGGGIDGVS